MLPLTLPISVRPSYAHYRVHWRIACGARGPLHTARQVIRFRRGSAFWRAYLPALHRVWMSPAHQPWEKV